MKDIATACGVSKNTVSLALRHDPQIPKATRIRIVETANRLGYTRNPVVSELMVRLRSESRLGYQASLALINGNTRKDAFVKHPTVPTYVAGCMQRAQELGYTVDTFWMYEAGMRGKSWIRLFRSRGIRGAVIVGMMLENTFPEHFKPLINEIPCVVTGVRTRNPALSFACVDHYILTLLAFEKAAERGYKRIGLVIDQKIDQLVECRFSAGYRQGQNQSKQTKHLTPFYRVEEARQSPHLFKSWLEKECPDVILTLYGIVQDWLTQYGYCVPDDLGLIQLEWRKKEPNWAGMNQHNEVTGASAVDMLTAMLHRGENGVPEFPLATLIGPTWVDGDTLLSSPISPV